MVKIIIDPACNQSQLESLISALKNVNMDCVVYPDALRAWCDEEVEAYDEIFGYTSEFSEEQKEDLKSSMALDMYNYSDKFIDDVALANIFAETEDRFIQANIEE